LWYVVVCNLENSRSRRLRSALGRSATNCKLSQKVFVKIQYYRSLGRSQRPRGLRRRSAAARLLRLWARIQPATRMSVCCECCVLSGRGLFDELITRPEESYRMCCVVVCYLENLVNEEALAHWRLSRQKQTNKQTNKKNR